MTSDSVYEELLPALGQVTNEAQFDYQSFVPNSNGSFDAGDQRYGIAAPTAGLSSNMNTFPITSRRPSQQDMVGSPASSYAPSISDGRHGSISYSQPMFKIPAGINMDRRGSLPAATAQNEFPSVNGFSGQDGSTRAMHGSQWTPNFSFGNATPSADSNVNLQNIHDGYKTTSYIPSLQHDLQTPFGMDPPSSSLLNYDRRMSHPVLPSGSFGPASNQHKPRQASAVDWRTYTNPVKPRRPSTGNMGTTFGGGDHLWNSMDSARGMVAMSNQGQDQHEQFKIQMARRRSMPYLPAHQVIKEDTDQFENFDGSGLFATSNLDLSDDGSMPLQPTLGSDGNPDQASMMTTFNAKDTNSGHKKHICPVCKKRFTRPSSLTTHIYSHTGEKPFICEVDGCGRHFSVISNLRRHKKIHNQAELT